MRSRSVIVRPPPSAGLSAGRRAAVRSAAILALGAHAACRGLLGLEPLPGESAIPDARARDATDGSDGAVLVDPAWAQWHVPLDKHPTNYEVSAGIAHDRITGLDWERATESPRVWDDAKKACEALEVGGRKGFRLPSRIELLSIMDFANDGTKNPFPPYFLDPDWNCYWTISGETDQKTHWLLATEYSMLVISNRNDTHCVARCVVGPAYDYAVNVPPAYVVENGVVRDPLTHLEWEAWSSRSAGDVVALDDAERRCADLGLNDHADWRLPTIKELETLVDEHRILPALDPQVAGESNVYWSSTEHLPTVDPDGGALRLAWRVNFTDGTMAPADSSDNGPAYRALVRCVRPF